MQKSGGRVFEAEQKALGAQEAIVALVAFLLEEGIIPADRADEVAERVSTTLTTRNQRALRDEVAYALGKPLPDDRPLDD